MFSNKIKISSKLSILVLITIGLVLNDVCSTNAAPTVQRIKPKQSNRLLFNKRHFEPIFDEVNKCILACGKCADDLLVHEENEDPEQTPSILCANECLSPKVNNKDYSEGVVLTLLSNKIFDKNFVKCFVTEMVPTDYNYSD